MGACVRLRACVSRHALSFPVDSPIKMRVQLPYLLLFMTLFLGSGPVGDDDLWHHHIGGFSPFFLFLFNLSQLRGLQSQLGGL